MLEGKELIVATKAFTAENRGKSWYCILSTLCLFAIAQCIALFCPILPIRLLAGVCQGLVMVRLFVIYHDYEHHTILQHSSTASIIMQAIGIYMLAPQSIWKRSHDFHHKQNSKLWTASIGSYPVVTVNKFGKMSDKERRQYLMTRHPLTLALGYFSMFLVGMCVRSVKADPKRHSDSLLALLLHAIYIAVVTIFLGYQALIAAIAIPFLMSCAIGAYLFFVQHNFPAVQFQDNADWTYERAALQSSSYMKMNPFMHWVTGNIGYHHIHHLNSRIPFYRLPEVLAHFPELQTAGTTSWRWSDMRQCLKLKTWDEEKGILCAVPAQYKTHFSFGRMWRFVTLQKRIVG